MRITTHHVAALCILSAIAAVQVSAGEQAAAVAAPVTAEVGSDGLQRATLTLDSYSFSPAHLVIQAGKPVELTLSNVSTVAPHNLILDDPGSGLSLHQEVAAGKTAMVTFTPTRTGSFAFYCGKKLLMFPSHRAKGMEGVLEVR